MFSMIFLWKIVYYYCNCYFCCDEICTSNLEADHFHVLNVEKVAQNSGTEVRDVLFHGDG